MPAEVSDSELEVLAELLAMKSSTAKDLSARLAKSRPWAHSTVVTFLRRLETKGLVEHTSTAGQRAFLYKPTRRGRSLRRRALADFMDRAFGGNPLPLVSSLLEDPKLTEDQFTELRRLIDDHSAERGRKS